MSKQIFLVYCCNLIDQELYVIFATTSVHKLKKFIINKIESNNENIFYQNEFLSKEEQIEKFKKDFERINRNEINEKLYGLKYTYLYDGEEK